MSKKKQVRKTQATTEDPAPTKADEKQVVPSEMADVTYTPEEVAEIKEIAKTLMSEGKGQDLVVVGACITLLAARQIYMASLVDLDARLKELAVEYQDGVRQTFVDAMQNKAQDPFTRTSLMEKIQKHVLPWLAATVQSENAKEAREEAERERRLDETRRDSVVPIGFSTAKDLPDDPKTMDRERTLALAGHPGAVKYLLRVAASTALKKKEEKQSPKLRVLHLSCYDPQYRNAAKRSNKDKLHLVLSEDQWAGKCTSEKKFTIFMLGWCRMMRRRGIDLLLIDDATKLMEPRVSTVTPIRNAHQAQRYVRKWAARAGCAVLCGIPTEESAEAPAAGENSDFAEWEVYTTLRRISLQAGDYDKDYETDTYKIFLDNGALAANDVARKVIDNYKDAQ